MKHVSQLMSGGIVGGDVMCPGDEEHLNLLPPAQFLKSYVFFADPTYSRTTLVITRTKTESGFKAVSVDCVGEVTGWAPVGTSGEYEYASIDIVKDWEGLNTCKNGPHSAESEGPFGVNVWGISIAASYAYPAGGNVAKINSVVVSPTPK